MYESSFNLFPLIVTETKRNSTALSKVYTAQKRDRRVNVLPTCLSVACDVGSGDLADILRNTTELHISLNTNKSIRSNLYHLGLWPSWSTAACS